jgi:niacin transporter
MDSMMKRDTKLQTMVVAALLCAIGIVIPMFAPKIMLPPASFTLASHVPIFIAMFISPPVALAVSIVTTVGFFFAGFPLVIVLRALTHVIFAMIGAFILKKKRDTLTTFKGTVLLGFLLAVIHAVNEVIVVTVFFFGDSMSKGYYTNGYFISVIALVGFGTIIHSMIDFGIAVFIWKPLSSVIHIPYNARIRFKGKALVQ